MFKEILAVSGIVLMGLLFFILPAEAELLQSACGAGQIQISEVNYATAGEAEFIEIQADIDFSLDGFEIRLISSSGAYYSRHSLSGETTSDLGYFVIKGDGTIDIPSVYDREFVMDVGIVDWIRDDAPGGIGIYDVSASDYCNFINYGGTVSLFDDYLQIGSDEQSDGQNRSCAYAFSSWRCGRPSTPASPNSTVTVQMNNLNAVTLSVTLTLTLTLMLMLITPLVKRK